MVFRKVARLEVLMSSEKSQFFGATKSKDTDSRNVLDESRLFLDQLPYQSWLMISGLQYLFFTPFLLY